MEMWRVISYLTIVYVTFASRISNHTIGMEPMVGYSFEVDYGNDQFLLDGKPFRYVSGSFHYFRSPKQYWRDRLRKLRAAGLNAVSTYVEWSLHEPEPGVWNWKDEADILEFLTIAQEEDLFVLLRPGPYICAERDLGGLPTWLLSAGPDMKLRTHDQKFMKYVEAYLRTVLMKVKPYLRGNGGPIIMVQVENEYGSFKACDVEYRNSLKNIFHRYVQSNAVLYTTDGPQNSMLKCGSIPGVYATVDFGTSSNVTSSFQIMRRFQPKGPLVNSEFYPGWLSHWEEALQNVATLKVVKALDEILSTGASVNIYMFYGGTNFGFTSGANTDPEYRPQLTSYDYDAPLTESGDLTPKYFAMRDVIASYLPLPDIPIPASVMKKGYGPIIVEPLIKLFDPLARNLFSSMIIQSERTPTFEELQLRPLQLVLYEAHLSDVKVNSAILETVVHDRAHVYLDERLTGILSRSHKIFNLTLKEPHEKNLALLVENQGHINYGEYIHDYKGLWNVTVNKTHPSMWNVTGFALNDIAPLQTIKHNSALESGTLFGGPVFFRANFSIKGTPFDTFLDTTGWGKGVAYINGYNIGRYWPSVGPQKTLYVPAIFLNEGANELIVLEYEYVPISRNLNFRNAPKFGFNTFNDN